MDVEMAGWDDSKVDWTRYDVVVPRSTWNYYEHEPAFRAWITKVALTAKLWNPKSLILRTLDKRYLLELEARGIEIVPTRLVTAAEDLPHLINSLGWDQFVLKPTVSAASYMTQKFDWSEIDEAVRFARTLLDGRLAIVQQYMSRVEQEGEVNIVHIDGARSHAIFKYPRYHGGVEDVADTVCPITPEQASVADAVMDTVSEPWLYARVDLMEKEAGKWVLSELEVIEPSLFFVQHPPALTRFVAALARL